MASLEPVKQKIAWAKKHLTTLDVEAHRYLDTDCCTLVIERDAKTNRAVQRLTLKGAIPKEIPLIIGDIIHSLRCSLDYLVWQLILAAGNEPQDFNQFPICIDPNSFASATNGKRDRLLGVSIDARTEIEGIQPYITSKGQEQKTSLYVLQALSNRDKHRRILLAVARGVGINAVFDKNGVLIHRFPTPTEDGAESFVGPVPSVGVGEEVKVESTFIPFITFDEGFPMDAEVRQVIYGIIKTIETSILPRFERFFS